MEPPSQDTDEIDFEGLSDDLLQFQEDEMVQQALQRGVDLKRYGAELEKELKAAEAESVGQYVENSPQVVDLHKQMLECDAVLARMQDMLLGFQADLGGISEEIKHLQDESLSMSIRLKNRKAAEERLRNFIDNSSISPDMAANIASPSVNDAFLEAVEMEWKRGRREKTPLAVLFLGIDGFSDIDRRLGSGAGDDCLRHVAAVLGTGLRRAGDHRPINARWRRRVG